MEIPQQTTNQHETIRKTSEALLRLMGFADAAVAIRQLAPEEPLMVAISIADAGILIGDRGANLAAFEYVAKLVTKKIVPDGPRYVVDINGYREQRFAELRELAHSVAGRVVREQQEIALDPMPGVERRIIHLELASRPDVKTESEGEGAERRLVVKPLQ